MRRRRAVILGCAVLATALAAELSLRTVGFGRGIRYRPHPRLGWEMVPGQQAFNVRGRAQVKINRLGFRGPEVVLPRPQSTYRIFFLGDGATLANQVPESDMYPVLVQRELARRWPERAFDFAIGAVSSYQLEQQLELLRMHIGTLQPTAVVIGFCWNDWAETTILSPGRGPEPFAEYHGRTNLWARTATADFFDRLGKIIERRSKVRAYSDGSGLPQATHEAATWSHVESMLDSIAATARAGGADVVLLILPSPITDYDPQGYATRRARLESWAADRSVRVADPDAAIRAAAAGGARLFFDTFHLSVAAQPLIAAAVVIALADPPRAPEP